MAFFTREVTVIFSFLVTGPSSMSPDSIWKVAEGHFPYQSVLICWGQRPWGIGRNWADKTPGIETFFPRHPPTVCDPTEALWVKSSPFWTVQDCFDLLFGHVDYCHP